MALRKVDSLVYCKTRFIGFHCWPNAPEEVDFLRCPHRHEFYVEVSVRALHADRDVEFITLRHKLDCWLQDNLARDNGSKSCEMMCDEVADFLELSGYSVHGVTVSEDDENGALTFYEQRVDSTEDGFVGGYSFIKPNTGPTGNTI